MSKVANVRRSISATVATLAILPAMPGATVVGTTWTVQPAPNPSGKAYTEIAGVDGVSTTSCTAVGSGVAEGYS